MAIHYRNFVTTILRLLPLIFLFYISLKDDTLFNIKFFNLFSSINLQYIIIYYWILKSPKILGYGFVFIVGIITDVILGLPMGISSLTYLSIAAFAAYTRIVTVRISLLTDWFTFIPALLIANFIYFFVLYFNDIPVNYLSLLLGALLTFLLYPFLWIVFEILRKLMKVGTHA